MTDYPNQGTTEMTMVDPTQVGSIGDAMQPTQEVTEAEIQIHLTAVYASKNTVTAQPTQAAALLSRGRGREGRTRGEGGQRTRRQATGTTERAGSRNLANNEPPCQPSSRRSVAMLRTATNGWTAESTPQAMIVDEDAFITRIIDERAK